MIIGDSVPKRVRQSIAEETVYDKHYEAIVAINVDADPKSGAIQCMVPALGWNSPDNMARVLPSSMRSLIVPVVGAWVDVYFLDGDREKPRYQGLINETPSNMLVTFDGLPTTNVLFESPVLHSSIIVDDLTGTIKINPAAFFQIGTGTDKMVLGNQLLTVLNDLVAAINANIAKYNLHYHSALGSPPVPPNTQVPIAPVLPTFMSLRNSLG